MEHVLVDSGLASLEPDVTVRRNISITCSRLADREVTCASATWSWVGSGAAGLTAALTAAHRGLAVVVVEKAERFGGSTARSGGGVWIPNNSVLRRAKVPDTPRARPPATSSTCSATRCRLARRAALLAHGPAMLDLVRGLTPLDFAWVPGYADYYPELPGGMPRGRTIEPKPLDAGVPRRRPSRT